MIIVIDYDAGNTANVLRALAAIGAEARLSANPKEILAADGLILPGVGAFRTAMQELQKRDLIGPIQEAVSGGKPFLGICLGMQLLLEVGLENGQTSGLGFIPGVCRRIPDRAGLPVPHMGWNDLQIQQPSALTNRLQGEAVYFVHSYYTDVPEEYLDVTADYGLPIPAMIHRGSVFGCQFHPEKSGAVGLGILEKFKEYVYENTTRY
ncbi:imidazole glycerol phosphate synthase subunit HisH [Streptococcus sinensis]|uniref:Imidazole glycerol phosphate synthase subunit HisH n=1 Tax=Streptococcus sinensis TaxID=176090 RepID=A0A0A0DHP3_9STRE|nr:imidazole glycerol phosphate synthase subunit HisH [Streptococcus sinensis]KGM37580.1 Imidazole glycerol phosphate synthase amidotransferase subunit [Streptococcus sinensis]